MAQSTNPTRKSPEHQHLPKEARKKLGAEHAELNRDSRSQPRPASSSNSSMNAGNTAFRAVLDAKATGRATAKFSSKGSEDASESEGVSEEARESLAPLPMVKPLVISTAPLPVPLSGAGTSSVSVSSEGSRAEKSTASESQQAKKPRRRDTAPSKLSKPPTSTTTSTARQATTTRTTRTTRTTANTTSTTNTTDITHKAKAKTPAKADRRNRTPLRQALDAIEIQKGIETLNQPDQIISLAKERDRLLDAFDARDWKTIETIVDGHDVQHYFKHYPRVSPTRNLDNAKKTAKLYKDMGGNVHLVRHVKMLQWVSHHHTLVLKAYKVEADMHKLYPKPVQELCCAMAACHEKNVEDQAKALKMAIQAALKLPRLDILLAQQPFAGMALLKQRTLLLQQYAKGKTVEAFRQILWSAAKLQNKHGLALGQALLAKAYLTPDERSHLLMNYAVQVTSSYRDAIADSVNWAQLGKIRDNAKKLLERAIASAPDGKSWEVTVLKQLTWRLDVTFGEKKDAAERKEKKKATVPQMDDDEKV